MNRTRVASLTVLLLGALALRIYQIAIPSFWLDEMFSLHVAKHNGWEAFTWDTNPFLYYFLLDTWVDAFGDNELFVRLLSTLFSLGSLTFLFFIGKKAAGTWGALVCSGLALIHPLSVEYAREARMYSLFEFLTSMNLYFFFSLQESRKRFVGWILSLILLSLTHLFAAILVFAELFWWLLLSKRSLKQSVLTGLGAIFGFFLVIQTTGLDFRFLDWQKLRFDLVSPLQDYLSVQKILGFGHPWTWVLLALSLFVLPYSVRSQIFRDRSIQFSAGVIGLTLGGVTLASFLFDRSLLLPRYFIFLIPFVCFLTTQILNFHLKGPKFGISRCIFLLLVFVCSSLFALPEVFENRKAPWRDVANYISHIPNQMVLTTRSQSIQTPYFQKHLIPVRKWQFDQNGLQEIFALVESGQNVFIVENYWGGLTYWEDLKAELTQKGYKINEQTFQLEQSEALYTMQIRK